jgi:Tfp pilus assembly protein PilO
VKSAFPVQKRIILAALGGMLLLDLALAVDSWTLATAPQTPGQERVKLAAQVKLLRSDLERASAIRKSVPAVQQDCDRFENSVPVKTTGYSALLGNLDSLARKAGLQTEGLAFKEQSLAGHGLTEVEVTATVNGDYSSVVRFINGIQRSEDFYILDDLSLASAAQTASGQLRVNLHLRTYFRS